MKKILELLKPLLRLNISHPFSVIVIAAVLAIISGYFAYQLKLDTDIANLLPKDHPSVIAINELQEIVGGETEMQVAVQSPSFEANKAFVEALIPRSMELFYERGNEYYFTGYEYKKDTDFIESNALYLATETELDDLIFWLEDEIYYAKEAANPFFVDLGFEDEEEESDDNIQNFQDSYDTIVPKEYPINADSTRMVIKFYPSGRKSDLTFVNTMIEDYQKLLDEINPQSFHPEMEVQYAGRLKRHTEQISYVMQDVISSVVSGMSSVILLVMFYFFIKKYIHYRKGEGDGEHGLFSHIIRMPIPVLVIGIPLIFSLLWTFGITYFYLGILNTMTSVLFVILFGLGIDYGIHFYARYIEYRSSGLSIEEAVYRTNEKTGEAIVVSGLTTAFALYILMFAQFRGFSEFGFISGTGIILSLFSMLYVMPALLVIFERNKLILFNSAKKAKEIAAHRYPFARIIVLVGLVISGVVIANSSKLSFEYQTGKLEPTSESYTEFRRVAGDAFSNTKRNPAFLVADTDQEIKEIADVLRERMESDTLTPTILSVESLQERFPTTETEIQLKLDKVEEIRELLQDPFLVNKEDEDLDKLRKASGTVEPITLEQLPDYLTSRFVTKNGDVGKFVLVYPSVGLSDGRLSIAFKNDVGIVELPNGRVYHAASTSLVAANMLDLMRTESPYMVAATFIMVYIFMIFTFRSFRWSIISMLPLVVGLLWLFGIMIIFDLKFNFYNLVVLPAILGIGEDSGVHLAHRYREEGKNSMWAVLSSTGQHITIGSLTTMLGFAGLTFANHPGLQSLGIIAVVGIGMTLLTSLTFLPALIQWLEDRDLIKY